MRVALYGASLDPLTIGHMWVIEQAAAMFDELVIGVAFNPAKASKYTFTFDQRIVLARECCEHLPNVRVVAIGKEFLVRYARDNSIGWVVRGIRGPADVEYEQNMMAVNKDIASEVVTVLLACPAELAKISSSMIKSLVGFDGWKDIVVKYVPPPSYRALLSLEQPPMFWPPLPVPFQDIPTIKESELKEFLAGDTPAGPNDIQIDSSASPARAKSSQ